MRPNVQVRATRSGQPSQPQGGYRDKPVLIIVDADDRLVGSSLMADVVAALAGVRKASSLAERRRRRRARAGGAR